jgi:Regulator of volume decrease after cellular swelling
MREGNVYYGEAANLSQCRVAASVDGEQNMLHSVLLQQGQYTLSYIHDSESDKIFTILWGPSTVEADFHEEVASNETLTAVIGQLVVTSEQLLFWTNESSIQQYDLRVDATCLDLHALTSNSIESDNEADENRSSGVYIQLSDEEICDDSGYEALQEITFRPISSSEDQSSQSLFDAISKLITLHPIDPNDLPDGEAGVETNSLEDQGNMWFGTGPFMTVDGLQKSDIDDDDDHLVVASNDNIAEMTLVDEEAERNRMLERLDRLLVVPPEYEYLDDSVQELSTGNSQFEDAESDNE